MEQKLGSSSEDYLKIPRRGGRSLTTIERKTVDLSSQIPGWGSDLDPDMRPGVPRDKAPNIGSEDLYPDIEPQIPKFKIHKSTEHARLTPVFGTSCPPGGVSGKLRDFAYTMSEARLSRWMILLMADRVDMIEGVLDDLSKFHIPNIPREMGLASEWKYNKKGVITKAAIVGVAALGAYYFYQKSRESKRQHAPLLLDHLS